MNRADFIHLVRLSEQASAQNSQRYRRGVAAFAAIGYLWVIGCLVLAVVILIDVMEALAQGRFNVARAWLLVFALGLLWSTLRALWVPLAPPEGVRLERADAPGLFDVLERIRARIDGPPVHHVYLDAQFNASIRQLPRFGVLGGAVNYLSVGLPLLMALERRRFISVLAHEYGHLRGDHGRLSAWIYRTRLSWLRLDASLQRDQGVMAWLSRTFFHWYFPRFAARAFALARQDEYEADRVSARLVGTSVAAAALTEIAVRSAWYANVFWPRHWARAATQAAPAGPFAWMRSQLRQPPKTTFAREALREALQQISDVDDTHPGLRDRLEAFNEKAQLPAEWSARSALRLLADRGQRWIEHFDREWCEAHDEDWRLHHAYLERVRERVQALAASAARNNADEMVEWADLERRLQVRAPVRERYEHALTLRPDHPGALRGLVQLLPIGAYAPRLLLLDRLYATGSDSHWWAASTAIATLEHDRGLAQNDELLKLWRARLKEADEAEARAWEELSASAYFSHIGMHDLSEFEADELRFELRRCEPLARAWVVRKSLREFPWRRAYIVFVELPGLTAEDAQMVCQHLESSLNLPGATLVLAAGESPTLKEIERNLKRPFWDRSVR